MIGSAEDVHESVEKAAQIKEEHQWDYVVCLTDLPSISDNKVVVSDFNSDKHVAMLSLPSLGFIDLKRKLVKTMTSLIEQLYYNQPKDKNAPHPFVRVKAVEPDEDATSKQRYINILFIISWIQLIGGLTRANQPWKNIFNFKKIISVAFATGTYVSIFSMPWELSVIYSPLRLIILMVIAILGMAGWLFYAHQLIEKKTAKSQRVYRYIYNSTTLVTLSLITLINYVILYLLLIISITLFVPVELFNSWTSAQSQFTFSNYMRLIWFVSSLGLLAGAMGSTVENEEKIRRITYSYRQYHRYKEAEQEQKNKKLLVMYHNKMSNNKLQVKMKIMNNMKVKNKDIERRMTHDKSKTVGLVVAPGVTERLAENLIQEMPKMLSTHYDHQQEWILI